MRLSIVLDCRDPKALVPFWCAALGYEPAGSLPNYEILAGEGPVMILQQVDADKAGKNRMHLDLHPSLEVGVPAVVERLEALGGLRVGEPNTELLGSLGIWWQLMIDPEGNELDLVADPGHAAP